MLSIESISPQDVNLVIETSDTGDELTIEYKTPNGNQPNAFGNKVYLWESKSIPWGIPPKKTKPVPTNKTNGTFVFEDLGLGKKDYVIGYATGGEINNGEKYGNTCAMASLPIGSLKDPSKINYETTSITKMKPSSTGDSLLVYYQTLEGLTPKSNGAWMALWRGEITDPHNNTKYLLAVPVLKEDNIGSVSFNFENNLISGVNYTVALMMSGWNEASDKRCQTTVASVSTFRLEST